MSKTICARQTTTLLYLTSLVTLAFTTNTVFGQTAMFDNLANGPQGGPQFDPGDRFISQPFHSGAETSLGSVVVNLYRQGAPQGEMSLELWDDDSGIPGTIVETLGTIDASALSTSPGFIEFDANISLTADATYHVLLDTGDIPSNSSDTIHFGVLTSDEGTQDSGKLLYFHAGSSDWVVIDDLLGPGPNGERANYWQMSVSSVPEPSSATLLFTGGLIAAARTTRRSLNLRKT